VIVYGFSAQNFVIFHLNKDLNYMEEIFFFLKPAPFSAMMGLSSSRFSQKLHGFKTKGFVQKFDEKQKEELKRSILLSLELIKIEVEKL
jgi:hypothetical protein